jgi:hypothetical protein
VSLVVLAIFVSARVALYETIQRSIHAATLSSCSGPGYLSPPGPCLERDVTESRYPARVQVPSQIARLSPHGSLTAVRVSWSPDTDQVQLPGGPS